jgi:hypothetical protein
MYTSNQLADVLRELIRRVEQSTDVSPDDPALLELKRIILVRIAALELEATRATSTPAAEVPPGPPADSS